MRGKRVGVEKLGKSSNTKAFLAMPEDASAVGYIRFVGDDLKDTDLKIGMKVYYGKDRHELRMDGMDILIMDEDNVYAIVEEPREEAQTKTSA
jgi:co-chaperonin GroES (HSP10)